MAEIKLPEQVRALADRLGVDGGFACIRLKQSGSMMTAQSLKRAENERIDWSGRILILSTVVTVGLIALYVFGKATSRW